MDIRVSKDEVLAWMAADPANRGPSVAAKHFGIKAGTLRAWTTRARAAAGIAAPIRSGVAGTLHVLPSVSAPVNPPATVVIQHPAAKPQLPASMQSVARRATRALIERIEMLAPNADPKEAAAMFAALTDRFDIIGTIKPATRKAVANPATAEGRAALVDEVAALPPDLLAEAMQRQRTG